jgi:hypothetical protein
MSSKLTVLSREPRTEAGPVSAPLLVAVISRWKEELKTQNDRT